MRLTLEELAALIKDHMLREDTGFEVDYPGDDDLFCRDSNRGFSPMALAKEIYEKEHE